MKIALSCRGMVCLAALVVSLAAVPSIDVARAQSAGVCSPGLPIKPTSISAGQSTSFSVFYECLDQPSETVTISIPNLPQGATFSPKMGTSNLQTLDGTVITISTMTTTPSDTYHVVVGGTGPTCGSYSPCDMGTFTVEGVPVHIYFDGKDVTNRTTNVAIGQKIALTTTPIKAGQTQNWTGNLDETVGGYIHDATGELKPTDFSQPSTTFFWTTQGTKNITYTVFAKGKTSTANTTFNVQGPTNPSVTTLQGNVQVFKDTIGGTKGWWLSLGDIRPSGTNTVGMTFNNNTAPYSGGKFLWAQLVVSKGYTFYYADGRSRSCTFPTALDTAFPYPTQSNVPSTTDSPDIQVSSINPNRNEVTYAGAFQMFLMWQSSTPGSIPVPLGSVQWGWSGTAVLNKTTKTWACPGGFPGICGTTGSSKMVGLFQLGNQFPLWAEVTTGQTPSCHDQ